MEKPTAFQLAHKPLNGYWCLTMESHLKCIEIGAMMEGICGSWYHFRLVYYQGEIHMTVGLPNISFPGGQMDIVIPIAYQYSTVNI